MDEKRMTDKQSIRSKYLAIRNTLTSEERFNKSKLIWERLQEEKEYLEAEILLVYMDYRSEVMTTSFVTDLLEEKKKRIFAPTVEGMNISFYEVTSITELVSGYQGIREPVSGIKRKFDDDLMKKYKCLILVPGAVFDEQMGRMGYGKGFYDRFFDKYDGIIKAGLAFECQMTKQVPAEVHDVKMDMIITENHAIKSKGIEKGGN